MEQQLILDRYRPLEDLGEGAFGSVVLAWDTRMQRRVAIKRLPLPLDAQGMPHQPLGLVEARTAAMLNHPSIVTVFDFDMDRDEAFLVMEFADGCSLGQLLDDVDGPLTADEVATVVRDVASALAFAHRNGVLHLDVKPENVLIMRDGRVKVADFGIAQLSTLAGHGSAWGGTLGYMPPEQLRGEPVAESTDEWALAALAYEALTGRLPFPDRNAEQALAAIEQSAPAFPSAIEPDLNHAVDDVLFAALDPAVDQRYPSVSRFADTLLPVLGDVDAGRESLAELVADFAEDEVAEEPSLAQVGLWDRLRGPVGVWLVRIVAGAEAAWLAWAGLTPFGLEPLALWAAVALITVGALFASGLGIALGLACLIAGLFVAGAWAAALLVVLVTVPWWWFLSRRNSAASVLPLAGPLLGFARVPFAQPLIAGFVLEPVGAAVAALLGGVLTMLSAAASSGAAPYLGGAPKYALDVWNSGLAVGGVRALATSPAAYVALLGWPAAGALMSNMCGRASRLAAALGAICGGVVLGVAYAAADRIAVSGGADAATYTSEAAIISLAASVILVLALVALGAPLRPEEDAELDAASETA